MSSKFGVLDELKKMTISADECAELLSVTRGTLRNYRDKGLLLPIKLGHRVHYRVEDVRTFLSGKGGIS